MCNVKYLGVFNDCSLNFNHYISVIKKVSSVLGVIRKLKHFVLEKTLVAIYYALVYPYVTYGVLNWTSILPSSKLHLKQLQVLQNKCLRTIEG